MCADSPDTRIAQEAALRNADISQDALNWYKQIYADSAPDRAAASQAARDQSAAQTGLARETLGIAQDERQRYKSTFQPVEDKIVSDAMAYNTPQRKDYEARKAGADMEISLAGQRQATERDLERHGVMPGSGRALALGDTFTLGASKLRAGAENSARDRVEAVGSAKLMDAAGLGRGVVTNQATQAQIGLNAGNSSVANANLPNTITSQGASLMGQGYNTAMQGNTSAANINMGIANAQAGVDSANSQTAGAAGSAIGTIGMAIAI